MNFETAVCFFRIPKNASTSIYEHLGEKNIIRDENLKKLLKKERFANIFAPSHCKISEAVEELGEDILNFPCFAVCRNPYDRMVSQYFFCQKSDFIDMKFDSFKSFVDFCVQNDTIASMSQSNYLDLEINCSILRFENLQKDFSKFLEEKNIVEIDPTLPHKNKSNHLLFDSYYSKETKDMVYSLWEEDFVRFDYEK